MKDNRFAITRVSGQSVADEDLLADLLRVADIVGTTLTQSLYAEHGRYDVSTVIRRFDGWSRAVQRAGLSAGNIVNYSDEALFENILKLWQFYGRQPRRAELAQPPSTISQTPYNRRFGSWTSTLENFVAFADGEELTAPDQPAAAAPKRSPRQANLRLRIRVFKRDNYKCKCGRSPATHPGCDLHLDHIVPWSKGGETVESNLQTLCDRCNLGKGNT